MWNCFEDWTKALSDAAYGLYNLVTFQTDALQMSGTTIPFLPRQYIVRAEGFRLEKVGIEFQYFDLFTVLLGCFFFKYCTKLSYFKLK